MRKKITIAVDDSTITAVDQLAREEASRRGKKYTRTDFLNWALVFAINSGKTPE